MSALTDLFSSFANKIRSKTGSADTYTPTEMVDAIDDVYDAGAASVSLQSTKTVTATTSSQTVTPDVGYVGLEEVVVDPQTHTETYTPATNTAANDMGANNNYRYVNTSGMVTPTSITPSNSNPAALTSGSAVTPSANGYAIASYDSVTPSSTPTSVSTDDIVKIGGSGVIVDSVPTPASITPSNSAPVALAGKGLYRVNGDLGVIEGYAISSYTSKTPDDTTPPTVASGDIVKALASGYLYETIQSSAKVEVGTATLSTSSQTTITLGWKPKQVFAYIGTSASFSIGCLYDANLSTSYTYTGSSSGWTRSNLGSGSAGDRIYSITNSGFVMSKTTQTSRTLNYFAIG